MFETLSEAIAALDPPSDNASLAEVVRLHDQFEAKVALGVGEFDASGLWALDHVVGDRLAAPAGNGRRLGRDARVHRALRP